MEAGTYRLRWAEADGEPKLEEFGADALPAVHARDKELHQLARQAEEIGTPWKELPHYTFEPRLEPPKPKTETKSTKTKPKQQRRRKR